MGPMGPTPSATSLPRSRDGRGKLPAELTGRVGGEGGAWPPRGNVCTLLGAMTGCSQRKEATGRSSGGYDRWRILPRGRENLE